jgi:hypothetical protein
MLTFGSPLKKFNSPQQFCNRAHDESNVLDERTIKMGHAIEPLNVLGGF